LIRPLGRVGLSVGKTALRFLLILNQQELARFVKSDSVVHSIPIVVMTEKHSVATLPPPSPPQPLWQRVVGIVIGTAVGGIIYGIFLEALLIQSLLFDRKPLDPAHWRTGLTGRAWICGLFMFATLFFVPLRFLTRIPDSIVRGDVGQESLVGFLLALIFLIQIGTILYARMRPELCTIEHPYALFTYGCGRLRTSLSYSLSLWKNWVQIVIVILEFFQLFSFAIDNGKALQSAGVNLFPLDFLQTLEQLKVVVWQFGVSVGSSTGAGARADAFDTGFGLLCGFSGLYIFLCGVFIALDLTVDSPLSPLLFTLLAGGFYGAITGGLLLVIFFSPTSSQVIVSLILLAYYSSTAVFVSIYRSDAKKLSPGEVRLMPFFTAIERVSKGILAGINVVSKSAHPSVRASVAFVFCILLFVYIVAIRPYSVVGLTALRAGSVALAGWTALIVLICSTLTSDAGGGVLTGFLVGGWILIPIVTGILTKFVLSKGHPGVISNSPAVVINPVYVT